MQTLIGSHEKNKLSQLNLSVEKEVDWLYSLVGSIIDTQSNSNNNGNSNNTNNKGHHQRNQSVSKRHTKQRSVSSIHRINSLSNMDIGSIQFTQQQQEQIEIDWENIQQSAVL
eukprot:724388_1